MRRNLKSLILIVFLVVLTALILGFQSINLGGFQRGGDTLLGLSLGLDLQGGSHLVYQADSVIDPITGQEKVPSIDDLEGLKRIIERRTNASGLGEPIIQILGDDRLLIQLPGVNDSGRAKSIIGETAQLEFKHRKVNVPRNLTAEGILTTDDIVSISVGALPSDVAASPTPEIQPSETPVEEPEIPIINIEFTEDGAAKFQELVTRLNLSIGQLTSQFDVPSRVEFSIEGTESLKYEVAGPFILRDADNPNIFSIPYPQTSDVTVPGEAGGVTVEQAQQVVGANPTISFVEIQGRVDENFGLTGENLARAYSSLHTNTDRPVINIEFDDEGTRLFGEITTEIAGLPTDAIAIFLDDDELIAPVVSQPITTGTAIIQGQNITIDRARDIALLLESGRLPVPITLIQERDVDAILGADSLAKSVVAGVVGLLLVFLFMALYYRIPGLIAAVALVIYAGMVLAIFKIMPVTLTLSGVAAVILSVGMAVDANILIFERMKDELRNGRTLMSAINIGFNRAWPAIRDGNVSTLITCAILFYFANQLGTTIVQGFAVTLAVGVLISMFSAIVVSRTILRLIATTPLSRKLILFVPTGGSEMQQQRSASPAVQRS